MKNPTQLFSLTGKVAVVIGGTGVLCGEMAQGLAAAGASVALVGRDAAKAQDRLARIAADGGTAAFFSCDTTAKAGLILVTINPAYRLSELEYALNKVECAALVTATSSTASPASTSLPSQASRLRSSASPAEIVSL